MGPCRCIFPGHPVPHPGHPPWSREYYRHRWPRSFEDLPLCFLYDKHSSQRVTNQKEKSMVHFWTNLLHSWWRGISSRSWPYDGNILHFPESKSNIVPIAGPYIILIKFTRYTNRKT